MTQEEMMTFANLSKGSDMSSYEHFEVANKSSKRASGTAIAGIVIGSAALIAGVGAWVFGGVYAAQGAKANARDIDRLASFMQQEAQRNYTTQLNNQPTMKNYIDVATGGASAGAGASSLSTAQAQALAAILGASGTGNGQVCPQPVALYQPAMPCACNTCNN